MDIHSWLQGASDAAQDLFQGGTDASSNADESQGGGVSELVDGLVEQAGDFAEAAGEFVADTLEDLRPDPVDTFRWVSGPWVKIETVLDDDTAPNRIDDEGGTGDRITEGSTGVGTRADQSRMDGQASDVSRSGTTLIGIEAGLLKFLELNYEATSELGRFYAGGAIDFVKVQAGIFADAGMDWDKYSVVLRLGGQAVAELIGAHYEVGYDTPTMTMLGREVGVELTARLDAAVHAFARAWFEVSLGGRNAIHVGGSAFAGASATLAGQAELAPFADVHGSVTGWAGAGAEFTLGIEADFVDWEFGFDNSAGAAVGYGLSYDWGVSVSLLEVATFAYDHLRLGEDPQGEFQVTADDLKRIAADFIDATAAVVDALGIFDEEQVAGVAEGAKDVVDAIADGGAELGGIIVEAAIDEAEEQAGQAGGVAEEILEKVIDTAEDLASAAGDAVEDALGWFGA